MGATEDGEGCFIIVFLAAVVTVIYVAVKQVQEFIRLLRAPRRPSE